MSSKEGSDDPFNTNCTTWSVKDTLKLKHPPSQHADPEVCIQGNPLKCTMSPMMPSTLPSTTISERFLWSLWSLSMPFHCSWQMPRPIGIDDTSRRKSCKGRNPRSHCFKDLHTGQISGVEAVIHMARKWRRTQRQCFSSMQTRFANFACESCHKDVTVKAKNSRPSPENPNHRNLFTPFFFARQKCRQGWYSENTGIVKVLCEMKIRQ